MARRGLYRGRPFRSLLELSFWKHLEGSGVPLDEVGYEVLRIPYRLGRRVRTYVPDFLVGRRLFEVKPESRRRGPVFEAKSAAATEYCLGHGLIFTVVGPRDFRVLTARQAARDPGVTLARARGRKRWRRRG